MAESLWFVSPAFRRYGVTRLALAQRRWLCDCLAQRGIDAQGVIVADDENLDIAREHGFETVEMDNRQLGRKFNAGYRHAAKHGADYLVHIGSDDWAHPDLFTELPQPDEILTGRQISFVDLPTGRMSDVLMRGPRGVIPWVIPRPMLARIAFSPIPPNGKEILDYALVRSLRLAGIEPRWVFYDPPGPMRVDWKSDVNLHSYEEIARRPRERSPHGAWPALAAYYPASLVELARLTHLSMQLRAKEGRP